MITLKIDITTKKGHTVSTTWGVEQERVYPSLTQAHSLRWQGDEAICGTYCTPPTGLPESYRFNLLRSDVVPDSEALNSRANYAGYEGNPGTFELRGVSLGEMSGTFTSNPWPRFSLRVRGFEHPTGGERSFLEAAIAPALRAAVEANKAQLKAEAVAAVRLHVSTTCSDMRARLDKLERDMMKAIDKL